MQLASSGGTREELASAVFATPGMREDMGSRESGGQSNNLFYPKTTFSFIGVVVWPLCSLSVFFHGLATVPTEMIPDSALCNTCSSWGFQNLLMSDSSVEEPYLSASVKRPEFRAVQLSEV